MAKSTAVTTFVVIDMNRASELAQDLCANSLRVTDFPHASGKANASCEDFCRLFVENLDSLYQLCFLLTRDRGRAESCFSAGLDECLNSQHVFKEWAHAWAKRTVVQNAIWALQPRANWAESSYLTEGVLQADSTTANVGCFDIGAVLSLDHFERFVFVLTVLDQYSDSDCAFLLGCLIDDIRNARTRAVEQLGASCDGEVEANCSEPKFLASNSRLGC